jgi:HD-GYP domain-containing protein (c-di-GMP phosphodiesterase class II)
LLRVAREIANVFDALTHSRPYKKAWTVERAVA